MSHSKTLLRGADISAGIITRAWAGAEASLLVAPTVPKTLPRTGRGQAIGHHGEILQGLFEQPAGTLVRGLVTLTVGQLESHAVFRPGIRGALAVTPSGKAKALRAAEVTLARLGRPSVGALRITNNIAPRWGFGSSTSDVVATVRAVGLAFGYRFAPETIAEIAVEAETASDSTMFGERAVLFAQRRGMVIEELGPSLPPVHVVGFNLDPTGWGVDTLTFPPARYTWWEIEAFRPLLGLLRRAVRLGDAHLLGQVASASARMNQRHLPKPHFDALERIAERCDGVGVQVAHSGSIAGILLRQDDGTEARSEAVCGYLADIGITSTWRFGTGA